MDNYEEVLNGPHDDEGVVESEGKLECASDSDTQVKALEEDTINSMDVQYGPDKTLEEYEGQIKILEDFKVHSNNEEDLLDKDASVPNVYQIKRVDGRVLSGAIGAGSVQNSTGQHMNVQEDKVHSEAEEDGDAHANVAADGRDIFTTPCPCVPLAGCASPGTELARAESILARSLLPRDIEVMDTSEEDMGTGGSETEGCCEEEAGPYNWAQHGGDLVAMEEGRQNRQVSGEGQDQDLGKKEDQDLERTDSPVLGGGGPGLGRGFTPQVTFRTGGSLQAQIHQSRQGRLLDRDKCTLNSFLESLKGRKGLTLE